MALRYAVATGNWSNPATWNGGTLPGANDEVRTNNFTITIDQDVTVQNISTRAQTPAVAGGGFVISAMTMRFVTANILPGTTTCLTVSAVGTLTILGNIGVSTDTGVTAVVISNSSTVNVIGNISGSLTNNGNGITVSGTCTLNVTGDVSGGPATNAWSAHGIAITAAAAITIVGNVYPGVGSGSGGGGGVVVTNSSAATIDIVGDVSAAQSGLAAGTTSAGNVAVSTVSANTLVRLNGNILTNSVGGWPLNVVRLLIKEGSNVGIQVRDDAASPIGGNLITLSVLGAGNPETSDVRNGIAYGENNQSIGTLIVPPPSSVAAGAATDNTIGTAVLTPNDVWGFDPTTASPDTIGDRLANAATVATVGAQLAAALETP